MLCKKQKFLFNTIVSGINATNHKKKLPTREQIKLIKTKKNEAELGA